MAKHARQAAAPLEETVQVPLPAADAVQAPLPVTDPISVRGRRGGQGGVGSEGAGPGTPKRRSPRRILSTLLIVAGVVLLLVAGGMYGYQQWRYHESERINAGLAKYVAIDDAATEGSTCPVTVDWDALKAINPEVVGWLYIPGTTINYAVYQHADNEYYLRHSAEGEYSIGGLLFLDADNLAPGMRDPQSLIYGHHLMDGSMFEQIAALDEQERFDEVGSVWYVTEGQAFELVPVFFYDTDRDDVEARTTKFASAYEVQDFFARRLAGAITQRADAEQVVATAEHYLTLSTCVYYPKYEKGHGRGLLVCVPVDELPAAGE